MPKLTLSAPCLTQIGANLTPFESEVTRGGLSTAALISTPYISSHLAPIPWQGHLWKEHSLFLHHAGMHQGGDTAADILVPNLLAARGTEAFALGNASQLP